MSTYLDEKAIRTELADPRMREWRQEGGSLVREFEAMDFATAVRVVDRVVPETARLHRQPEIDIRGPLLRFAVRPADGGGLTAEDLELGHRIEYAIGTRSGME